MARVVVNVMPKAEILDPQGQAVQRALARMGVEGVLDVRQGKRFELEVADSVSREELEQVAQTLLANTVIEDFAVEVSAPEREQGEAK
ncbi:phosphoribosylformylglycinamidine synthase subunit PurS [Corynebacterium atypicum]|uniref:phosphoribosylformylglycinamidine synthase subunit PurS n=1 Tax=Corynebacterium atypicum TaxID=191610 RepID=UPI00056EFD6D|nr:phosphoribosylformylglycinamidine synthase subunit PurS [Corynebacterium atypicum]